MRTFKAERAEKKRELKKAKVPETSKDYVDAMRAMCGEVLKRAKAQGMGKELTEDACYKGYNKYLDRVDKRRNLKADIEAKRAEIAAEDDAMRKALLLDQLDDLRSDLRKSPQLTEMGQLRRAPRRTDD